MDSKLTPTKRYESIQLRWTWETRFYRTWDCFLSIAYSLLLGREPANYSSSPSSTAVIFCPWEALLGDEKRKKEALVCAQQVDAGARIRGSQREALVAMPPLFGTPACARRAPPKFAPFPWTSEVPFPILFLWHSYFSLLLFHPSKAFVNRPLYPIPSEIPSVASVSWLGSEYTVNKGSIVMVSPRPPSGLVARQRLIPLLK